MEPEVEVELIQVHEHTHKILRGQREVLDILPSWDMQRTLTTCFLKLMPDMYEYIMYHVLRKSNFRSDTT